MKPLIELDLKNNKYSMDILKENIYNIDFLDILTTQKINENFAVNYILNEKFRLTQEEKNITIDDVLKFQPQLNKKLLLKLSIMGPHDDNYPNFEEYSKS
jgi:hypothetical protein